MPFAQVEYTASFGIILSLSISLSQTDCLLVLQKKSYCYKESSSKKSFCSANRRIRKLSIFWLLQPTQSTLKQIQLSQPYHVSWKLPKKKTQKSIKIFCANHFDDSNNKWSQKTSRLGTALICKRSQSTPKKHMYPTLSHFECYYKISLRLQKAQCLSPSQKLNIY